MATTPTNPQGIQVLLEAEKEASRIVQKARQYRVQRLKDARTEAQLEIEALKTAKQQEYLGYEKTVVGKLDETVAGFVRQTDVQLKQVAQLGERKKEAVVKMLVGKVLTVQPAMHRNEVLRAKYPLDLNH